MSSCPACGRPVIRRRYAGALAGLARAHVDKLGECPSLRPRPGGWHARMWIGYDDVDRLFTCG